MRTILDNMKHLKLYEQFLFKQKIKNFLYNNKYLL